MEIHAGDVATTGEALEAMGRRAAAGLAALGVRSGDTLALLLHNEATVFAAWRAAALLGAVAVPIDRGLAAQDVAFILHDCRACALIAHADLLASLTGRLPAGLAVIPVSPGVWDAWLGRHEPWRGAPPPAPPTLGYTSGSTGRPKPVRREATRAQGSAKAKRVYGFDKPGRMVALVTGPLSHAVPRAFARLALAAGADIVLLARFDPLAALDAIARHGVTHVHLSPAMMVRMLRQPGHHDTASLRHVVHGAAPCPAWLKREAIAAWGPVVHEYYGSTETGLLTLADSADAAQRPGSVGRALPGIRLRVLDDAGRELPAGAAGTIWAASDDLHCFTYPGRDAERAAIARGDWVTAKDVGHLDADGYLYLHDRGRDLIRRGDETIVPARLEAAILALPDVADCAVLGLPGSGGQKVLACVEPLPGAVLDLDAIRRAAPEADRIEIVAALPRADTGKIFKHRLRALFAEAAAADNAGDS